jgi:hypothetical protein
MTAWQLKWPCQFVFSKSTNMSTNPPRCVLVRIVDGYAEFAKLVVQSLQGYAEFAKMVMQSLQSSREKIASRCRNLNPNYHNTHTHTHTHTQLPSA